MQEFNIIHKDLSDVWLNQAKETALNDSNIEEFYLRSGNKFIINQILKNHLGSCDPKLVFFEHSYFATTLDENKYTVFVCIWKKGELSEIQLKKFHSFFTTLDKFENAYPILWHPKFFISLENPNFYISKSDEHNANQKFEASDFVKDNYEGEQRIFRVPSSLRNESFYVGSFPFKLAFEDEVQRVIKQKDTRAWQPIEENNSRLRLCYDKVFDKVVSENSYKLAIPILGSPIDEKSEYSGQGSIWIYIISESKIDDEVLKNLAKEISSYFKDISINYIFQSGLKLAKASIQQAIRAAIAQVMARNMSHNIGSHVLNNLTDGERMSKEENAIVTCNAYQPFEPLQSEENKIIYQLAIYNHYVKCRMDYLSDVTFGTPVMHTNKKAFNELFKEFDKVRLLLEYISGLSDFKYKIIFAKNDTPITDETDFPVALPNDLLGCQAFYNIVENVIRNTAKHNQNKDGITEFTINFKDITKNSLPKELKESEHQLYEVEIFDNIKICDAESEKIKYKTFKTAADKELHKTFIAEYNSCSGNHQINAKTPVKEIDWLVYSQNTKLNLSVLQDNKLRNSSLGLLEMEASAAYLRKLDTTAIEENHYEVDFNAEIFNSKNKVNILKAINKKDFLGYRFFISKPTEFLLVGNFNIDENQLGAIANDGVLVKSEDKFKNELDNGIVYNHQFVLYQKSDTIGKILNDRKTSISVRKLEINSIQDSLLELITQNYSFIKLEEFIWQLWFNKIKGSVEHINVFTSYHTSYNQENKYNIALSNHNETWDSNKKDVPTGNVNYLESLSSIAQNKLPNYKDNLAKYTRESNGFLTGSTKHKLFESAKSKVVVIDERIQRFSNTQYSSDNIDVPVKDIFELTNVIVPEAGKINLGAKNYSPEIISDIEKFIEGEIGQCNFLLIHYSILERMYPNSKEEINNKLIFWSKPAKLRVIITSGRGNPHKLPTNEVCYVNLSPVLNVFTDARGKYSINYLLNAARK